MQCPMTSFDCITCEGACKLAADELERQKRTNAKLLDLLRKVDGALPASHDRVSRMIGEAERTKQVLDNCENLLDKKRADHG